MTQTINKTLLIGIGVTGYEITRRYRQQIRQRHPDIHIPIVETLALLSQQPQTETDPDIPVLVMTPRNDDWSDILPQFGLQPDDSEKVKNSPRLLGQVSLHQQAVAFSETIAQLQRNINSIASQETIDQQQLTVDKPQILHVFLIMSAAESKLTGLFPDLPFLIQHAIKSESMLTSQQFVHIYPVFLLPGFEGELTSKLHDPGEKAQEKKQIAAQTVAFLQEMDITFHDKNRYYQQFSDELAIYYHGDPLANGQIFLLESRNEKGQDLVFIEEMERMVSTWLYYVTFTSLRVSLSPPAHSVIRRRTYASFGLASISVPIALWRKRLALQLQSQLIDRLLQDTSQWDMNVVRTQLGLKQEQIRLRLIESTNYNTLSITAKDTGQANPWMKPVSLLGALSEGYSRLLVERVLPLREALLQKVRTLTSPGSQRPAETVDQLTEVVTDFLDKYGLSSSYQLIKVLLDDLENELGALQRKHRGVKAESENNSDIADQRQNYYQHTKVAAGIGGLPFFNSLAIALLGLMGVDYFLYNLPDFPVTLQNYRAGIQYLLSLVAIFPILSILYKSGTSLYSSREEVISSYQARLQRIRDLNLLEAQIKFYKAVIKELHFLRSGLEQATTKLEHISTTIHHHQHEESLNNMDVLRGRLSDGASLSILSEDDIVDIEGSLFSQNLQVEIDAMRKEVGSVYDWIEAGKTETEIKDALQTFCYKHVTPLLTPFTLKEFFRKAEKNPAAREELKKKLSSLALQNQPYWQYDRNKADLSELQLVMTVAVHNPKQYQEWIAMLEGKPSQFSHGSMERQTIMEGGYTPQDVPDQYEFVLSSVRSGFVLQEMSIYTQLLLSNYRALHQHQIVHTTTDRRVLSNASHQKHTINVSISGQEIIHTVTSMELIAIALGLGLIEYVQGNDKPYAFGGKWFTLEQLQARKKELDNIKTEVAMEYDIGSLESYSVSDGVVEARHIPGIAEQYQAYVPRGSERPAWAVLCVQKHLRP